MADCYTVKRTRGYQVHWPLNIVSGIINYLGTCKGTMQGASKQVTGNEKNEN